MKKAFTLVEILTVLVILVVLAAILFPAIIRTKITAKQSVCESNLHQIFLGLELYHADFGEYPWLQPEDPALSPWFGRSSFHCPNAPVKGKVRYDYMNISAPSPDPLSKEMGIYDKLLACREKRGSDFPLAADINHLSAVDAYQGTGRRVILVRASGAVVNIPYKILPNPPCGQELLFSNY